MAKKKRPIGRPRKYETPEEMEEALNEYFEMRLDEHGNWLAPPTMSGLALHLGFTDRQALYEYKGREEFSCSIKKALMLIESYHETKLAIGGQVTGNIFVLKNMKWKDKFEHETNTSMEITWNETRTYDDPDEDE